MQKNNVGVMGSTIKLTSGLCFDFSDPRPEMVRLDDIATALSRTCRFAGHGREFYSVAEHSVHCAVLALMYWEREDIARAVLLHDAAEAYVGDVAKPLKIMLGDSYADIERNVEYAIETKYGIAGDLHGKIKQVDLELLKAEKQALFPDDPHEWLGFSEIRSVDIDFIFACPTESKRLFLDVANRLGLASDGSEATGKEK